LRYRVYFVDVHEFVKDSPECLIEPNHGLVQVFIGKPAEHGVDVFPFRSDGNLSGAVDMADGDGSPSEELGEVVKLGKVCPIGCGKVYAAFCLAEDEFRSTRQGRSSSMRLMGWSAMRLRT